jgi:D-alanyl-D-alanine carboxypeptidase
MSESVVQSVVSRLESRVEGILAGQSVVGASVGVVRGAALQWSKHWGFADPGTGRAADDETLYPIASNTKPFTATAIMQLRDAGRLSLDDPLIEHVPEFERAAARAGTHREVTLRRLLTHSSGLSGEVPGNRFETGIGPSLDELLQRLDEVGIVVPPGTVHKYCNVGYTLLSLVVARSSGRPFEEYVRETTLEPLGMLQTTFAPEGGEGVRATPSQHGSEEVSPRPAVLMRHHAVAGAGGVRSSVADLRKWLAHVIALARDEAPGEPVVSPETMREMLRPQIAYEGWTGWQCLGWNARVVEGRVSYGHGGSLPGALSQARFSPAHDLGVVVLTSSDGHTAADDIATLLMPALQGAAEEAEDRAPRDLSPAPDEVRPYLGRYAGPMSVLGATLRIAWADGRLMLIANEGAPPRRYEATGLRPAPARLELAERGVLRATEGRWAGEELRFRFGPMEGEVSGFDSPSGSFYARLRPAQRG